FSQALATVGFRVNEMTDRNWLAALSAQLNWGKDASWRNPSPVRSEADKPLREQVLDYDRAIKVDSQGLMLGDYRVKTLSFKRLRERSPKRGCSTQLTLSRYRTFQRQFAGDDQLKVAYLSLGRASALRASFSQALATVGFRVNEMTDRNWLAALSAQLNWGK
ncbi:TraC family protein, partial [Bacillus sp. LS15-K4]|nr:TraC family protein [Bacillus sp. LS15-K4]